jgi:hypothetical protein
MIRSKNLEIQRDSFLVHAYSGGRIRRFSYEVGPTRKAKFILRLRCQENSLYEYLRYTNLFSSKIKKLFTTERINR